MKNPGRTGSVTEIGEEVTLMTGQELREQIKESLSKQLALLAKTSQKCKPEELVRLTEAMVLVAKELRSC